VAIADEGDVADQVIGLELVRDGRGAMSLPPEVLRSSFLRSVMKRKPSAVDVADVAGGEPAGLIDGPGGIEGARQRYGFSSSPERCWGRDEQLDRLRHAALRRGQRCPRAMRLALGV